MSTPSDLPPNELSAMPSVPPAAVPVSAPTASEEVSASPQHDVVLRAYHALVRHGRFEHLLTLMARCQEQSKVSDEPRCMALEGVTGAGKSTLARRYARDYPPRVLADGMCIPVFRVETPSPVSPRGMASAMLEALQDPYYDRGSGSILQTRLVKLLTACHVELVILDDFHHLIDAETDRVLHTVSDWLKVLIKETRIPFVLIGMPGSLNRIFNANAQLSRLVPIREHLGTLQSRSELQRFLAAFEISTAGSPLDWPPSVRGSSIRLMCVAFLPRLHPHHRPLRSTPRRVERAGRDLCAGHDALTTGA